MAKELKSESESDEPVISKQVLPDKQGFGAMSELSVGDVGAAVGSCYEKDLFPTTLPNAIIDGTAITLYIGDEKDIYIPRGITEIKKCAFSNLLGNTESVIMPYGVKIIGDMAFAMLTKLSKVVLPSSIESIGDQCFSNCLKLKEIRYDGTLKQWSAVNRGKYWFDGLRAVNVVCADGTVREGGMT